MEKAGSNEIDDKYFGNGIHEPVFECWRYPNYLYNSSSCVACVDCTFHSGVPEVAKLKGVPV